MQLNQNYGFSYNAYVYTYIMNETKPIDLTSQVREDIFPISSSDIPQNVMSHFEKKSAALLHPDNYKVGNFEKFFLIKHEDGIKTYAAKQVKEYSPGNVDELTYFVDLDDDQIIGWSTLRYNLKSDNLEAEHYFRHKPFVDWTITVTEHQKKGLGTRRLKLMNELSLREYGYPLCSSTNLSKEAKKVWDHLVSQGLAVVFTENDRLRYRFLNNM